MRSAFLETVVERGEETLVDVLCSTLPHTTVKIPAATHQIDLWPHVVVGAKAIHVAGWGTGTPYCCCEPLVAAGGHWRLATALGVGTHCKPPSFGGPGGFGGVDPTAATDGVGRGDAPHPSQHCAKNLNQTVGVHPLAQLYQFGIIKAYLCGKQT